MDTAAHDLTSLTPTKSSTFGSIDHTWAWTCSCGAADRQHVTSDYARQHHARHRAYELAAPAANFYGRARLHRIARRVGTAEQLLAKLALGEPAFGVSRATALDIAAELATIAAEHDSRQIARLAELIRDAA